MSDSDQDFREELRRARTLASDGLEGEALILLRNIVHREPWLADAHYLIAALLLNQKAYDEALEAAERCLELDPDNDRAERVRDTCREALSAQPSAKPTSSRLPGASGTFVHETQKKKVPMRRCPSCGQEIVRGARICRHCGASIGMPQWLKTISKCLMGTALIVVLLYFLFSVVGRRSINPILVRADGTIVDSSYAGQEDIALRLDRLQWHPGSILPAPIPADSGEQMYNSSYGSRCSGWVTNASDETLAYVVIYAHFSGRTGIHFGSTQTEVIAVAPGESKKFSMTMRVGNRPSNCEISFGEIEFGEPDADLALAAEVAQPSEPRGFPWVRFLWMSLLSASLLFGAARLQLACNPKIPWDYEWYADAVASVLAVPFIAAANAWLLFITYGATKVNLGPIVGVGIMAPFLTLLFVVAFFFKRGCGGVFLIWFFYGCLYLLVLRLMV